MPSLAEFQRDFSAALFAATPAPAGVRVHRNTTMKGLVDALLSNYPTVQVLMGEEWLVDVARNFALQHPPQRAALADYGSEFPEYLRAASVVADWPYVPAVAELDRAWTQTLLSVDAPALTPGQLIGFAPEAWASLRLQLHPAARYGVYAHSAVTVWQANRPPATPPAQLLLDDADEAALIVRNVDGIQLLPLDAAGRTFVEAIVAGSDIGVAAQHSIAAVPGADIATIWSTLLTHGAFAALANHGD